MRGVQEHPWRQIPDVQPRRWAARHAVAPSAHRDALKKRTTPQTPQGSLTLSSGPFPIFERAPTADEIVAERVCQAGDWARYFLSRCWNSTRRVAWPRLVQATRWPRGVHYAVRAAVVLVALVLSAAASMRGVQDEALAAPAEVVVEGDAPVVSGVTLKAITTSPQPQALPIAGSGFTRQTTVRLVSPMEEIITTFPSEALEALTPTSFRLVTMLEEPGLYSLTVRNGEGPRSDPITFTVKPRPRGRD